MTTQEAYELMRVYLTRPGASWAGDDKGCLYETVIRGATHRCAVGCLLSPETLNQTRYISHEFAENHFDDTDQGGKNVRLRKLRGSAEMLFDIGYDLPELDGVSHGFLTSAQACHDDQRNWPPNGGFNVAALDWIAADYGLTVVNDEPAIKGAPRELVTA